MIWFLLSLVGAFLLCVFCMIIDCLNESKESKKIAEKYNVSKFPVISKMGNQYYAEIVYEEKRFFNKIVCKFYERKFKPNGKAKDILLESNTVNFESFNFDYIEVVTQCINEYEEKHKAELIRQNHETESLAKNKILFNEWDGVIK